MSKRFLCLMLALVMMLSIGLTGCGVFGDGEETTTEKNPGGDADDTTKTLTMFMITERHVYTAEEVEKIKQEKGEDSKEYMEAKGVMEAYANVAAALDKITKAKFRTHLITYFYTVEEYEAVEQIMKYQIDIANMRKDYSSAYKKFKREQKAMGIKDEAEIRNNFFAKYPEYIQFTEAETEEETVVTEAETIINEYGIQELKYPDPKYNQIDIVCVCGYDNYLRYIDNGWLLSLDSELSGGSKAILTYVNEKFLEAAKINGTTYAIPNNTAIGEYTYLLLNKELYDFYQYDWEKVTSLSHADVQDFLKDIKMYEAENGWTPITGELSALNTFFWSLNYEYVSIGTDPEKLSTKTLYYIRDEIVNGNDTTYKYHRITLVPTEDVAYYTMNATEFTGTAFESGKTYYTKNAYGEYIEATSYVAGETYYTLPSNPYKEVKNLTSFSAGTVYYTKNSNTYTRLYTYNPGQELFIVETVSQSPDRFSVLGNVMSLSASKGTLVAANLLKATAYENQLYNIQEMKDNGYYDADALTNPEKKFASAVVKGNATLAEKYGDEYYMVVLEYPRASAEQICSNLIGVSSSTSHSARAMEVVTYLTTNADFRNLLQYGIEGDNYTVEYVDDEETEKAYPVISRINNYYQMDLYKTGNTFIAYPEEGMEYNAWDYGKLQNSDAKYSPMAGFNIADHVNDIDFSIVDEMAELSEKYGAMIEACTSKAELQETLTAIKAELNANKTYSLELIAGVAVGDVTVTEGTYNPYGIYHVYYDWWAPLYYTEE